MSVALPSRSSMRIPRRVAHAAKMPAALHGDHLFPARCLSPPEPFLWAPFPPRPCLAPSPLSALAQVTVELDSYSHVCAVQASSVRSVGSALRLPRVVPPGAVVTIKKEAFRSLDRSPPAAPPFSCGSGSNRLQGSQNGASLAFPRAGEANGDCSQISPAWCRESAFPLFHKTFAFCLAPKSSLLLWRQAKEPTSAICTRAGGKQK